MNLNMERFELRKRIKDKLKYTNSNYEYKRLRKYYLVLTKNEVNCTYCPYHRIENQKNKTNRNWKNYRLKQYKLKGVK